MERCAIVFRNRVVAIANTVPHDATALGGANVLPICDADVRVGDLRKDGAFSRGVDAVADPARQVELRAAQAGAMAKAQDQIEQAKAPQRERAAVAAERAKVSTKARAAKQAENRAAVAVLRQARIAARAESE